MVKTLRVMWDSDGYIYLLDLDPDNPGPGSPTGVGPGSRGVADPRQRLLDALVRNCKPALLHRDRNGAQALTRLMHPAHCEQRLALALESLKRSVGGDLPAKRSAASEKATARL